MHADEIENSNILILKFVYSLYAVKCHLNSAPRSPNAKKLKELWDRNEITCRTFVHTHSLTSRVCVCRVCMCDAL